jgi:hypothetical protein
MTQLDFEVFYPPASEDAVLALEKFVGAPLPTDYRAFLLTYNGGRVEPSVFSMQNCPNSTHGILNWLFGLHGGEYYDLLAAIDTYRDRVPPNLLPIGDDPGGNLICLSLSGSDRGAVYFWDHEDEAEEDEAPSYENMYLIGNSFESFMDSLVEDFGS